MNSFDDPEQAEATELDILTEKGMSFEVPRHSWLSRLTGKSTRQLTIRQPYLGTVDHLSREYLLMEFDLARYNADPVAESKRLAAVNGPRCARIVAIAVLRNRTYLRWGTRLLTNYLLWRLTPAKLWQITLMINQMSHYADFINSIRFLSTAQTRTTAPLIEENQELAKSETKEAEAPTEHEGVSALTSAGHSTT